MAALLLTSNLTNSLRVAALLLTFATLVGWRDCVFVCGVLAGAAYRPAAQLGHVVVGGAAAPLHLAGQRDGALGGQRRKVCLVLLVSGTKRVMEYQD